MQKRGFAKNPKQCRERWIQQLNPLVTKEKWSLQDNRKLLEVYLQRGNHWKEISTLFPGRTDNATKNQFFSLIRKGLRKACKLIGRTSNTAAINGFKPKVLSQFFNSRLGLENEPGLEKIRPKVIDVGQFIAKMAFSPKEEVRSSAEEKRLIEFILGQLQSLKSAKQRFLYKK